jgi:hypothetical protein
MVAMRDEPSGWEQPDERELARLDLVGLACEVVTLAERIAESVRDSADPRAAESAARREALCQRSLQLLAPETDFGAFSDAALEQALDQLRQDQHDMLVLRGEVERILASWSTM